MPGCGKGLITTCRFVRRYRSPGCGTVSAPVQSGGSPDHVKAIVNSRGQGAPDAIASCASCHSAASGKTSISAPMSASSGDGNAAERNRYVLRPGMLGEPELELLRYYEDIE